MSRKFEFIGKSSMPQYILILKISLIIWLFTILNLMFLLFKRRFFIKNTPISKLSSAAQGYVTVAGTLSCMESEKPLLSPISKVNCAWYYYKLERKISILTRILNKSWYVDFLYRIIKKINKLFIILFFTYGVLICDIITLLQELAKLILFEVIVKPKAY